MVLKVCFGYFISFLYVPISETRTLTTSFLKRTVPLIFGTIPVPPKPTTFEMALSKYMQRIWGNYAKNPYAGPSWPAYPAVAVLGTGGRFETIMTAGDLDTRCAVLDPYFEYVPSGES